MYHPWSSLSLTDGDLYSAMRFPFGHGSVAFSVKMQMIWTCIKQDYTSESKFVRHDEKRTHKCKNNSFTSDCVSCFVWYRGAAEVSGHFGNTSYQGKVSHFAIKSTMKPMYQQILENEYCI